MEIPVSLGDVMTWVAGLGVVTFIRGHNSRLRDAEKKLDALPETYARKDDLTELKSDLKTDIGEIKGDLKSLLNIIMGRPGNGA
jgi:hypothetical protein